MYFSNYVITLIVALFLVLNSSISYSQEATPSISGEKFSDNPETLLTLEQAINRALNANRTIKNARYRSESQEHLLDSAASEFEFKFVPSISTGIRGNGFDGNENNIDIGFVLQKKFITGTKVTVGPSMRRTESGYNTRFGMSMVQPLLSDFGKDVNYDGIQKAEYAIRSSKRGLYQTKVNTVLETISAVYDVIKQKEIVELHDSLALRMYGYAKSAKVREEVGGSTAMDSYRAEIKLKDIEDKLTIASNAFRDAKDRLKFILAIPLETEIDVTAPLTVDRVDLDLDTAIEIAFKNRVELEQIKDEIKEAERSSRIAKKKVLPDVNLVFDYSSSSGVYDSASSNGFDDGLWGLRLESTTDIARTAKKAAYKQSLVNTRSSKLNLESRQEEIINQVRRELYALKNAEERISIRKDQIKQAEGKQALSKVKFIHGMADNFDLIEAETELQRARVDLVTNEIDYIVKTYKMKATLGSLLERDVQIGNRIKKRYLRK